MTHVPIDAPAVTHGLGLFETMLVHRGTVLLLEEHCERMRRSARALGFPEPDRDRILRESTRAAASIRDDEAAVRCVWIASGASEWALAATPFPIPPATRARRAHGRVALLDPSFGRALPEHKLTSYAVCVIGLRRALDAGSDEGLFVTRDGLILEGTSTNVFAVAGRTLVTAPLPHVLPGVMRGWVMREAARLGLSIEERFPTVDELEHDSFLTGSLTTLAAIRSIDRRSCHPRGELLAELADAWTRTIRSG